jgi:beta-lactamase superfamily II metal-dependent hydrolase
MVKPKLAKKAWGLKVYLFNVGQGDHLLLELPDGKFGIIDSYYEAKKNIGRDGNSEQPALTHLKHLKERGAPVVISFICISHPDRDHTKEIQKIFDWITQNDIKVESLWLYPGIDEIAVGLALANSKDPRVLRLRDDLKAIQDFIKFWGGNPDYLVGLNHLDTLAGPIEVCVIAPLGSQVKKADIKSLTGLLRWSPKAKAPALRAANLVSSVIKMRFCKHQLLFGGDTGERYWQECLDEFDRKHKNNQGPCSIPCRGNFVKASHHGSRNSSSVRLWERILGESVQVAISAGKGHQHPHRETISNISVAVRNRGVEAKVFATNVCDKCVASQNLPEERLPMSPGGPGIPVEKSKKEALAMIRPKHSMQGMPHQTRNPSVREALASISPFQQREGRLHATKSLAAYIFHFRSTSDDIEVSKAVTSTVFQQDCIFGHTGERYFPECSRP